MNKIIELKKQDDAISFPNWETVENNSATLYWGGKEREVPYHLAIRTPSRDFQAFQDRANQNINTPVLITIIYEGNYYFAFIDQRGVDEDFFLKDSVPRVFRIDFQSLRKKESSTWTENFAETETMPKVQIGLSSIEDRLRKFATLKPGWDSYNARPIKWTTITRVTEIFSKALYIIENRKKGPVPIPFVAPRSDGGIQFEWNTCYKKLSFLIPANEKQSIEYLKVNKTKDGEVEEEGETSRIEELISIVTDWLL